MKRNMSILLALALILVFSNIASAKDFTDTAGLKSVEQAALQALTEMNVISGYPDGTFRPAATVTRAEFSKMIIIFSGQSELKEAVSPFGDVFLTDWFYGWVCRAERNGWIFGYPGATFRPQNSVTQQEVAAVLIRLAGVNTKDFVWPDDYIDAAQAAGAFKDIYFVGAAPASRILTCQMLYNMQKKPENGSAQQQTVAVHGIVTSLTENSVTIKDGKGESNEYSVGPNLLSDKLIVGSYLELSVNGKTVVRVAESIIPKKGANYWDVALDGSNAIIEDSKYDLTDTDIFAVEYTLSKPYSEENFIKGGPLNRDVLAFGGRLAAEMAVVVEAEGGKLITAYLVNATVIVAGGRLDVVDGNYSSSRGSGVYFLGRDLGLPMELSSSSIGTGVPPNGLFIHYTLRNGVINTWQPLLDLDGDLIYPTLDALKNGGENDPYAWVDTSGKPTQVPPNIAGAKPLVKDTSLGKGALQLGADSVNYWLVEGCLIFEVGHNGEIKQGNRSSIEKECEVIALVNHKYEICYLFCFVE
ncbi:MAG: S-layer homology domain-containing protein [Firmicutes bacterium]|nr:S-layer homology domain-containing protein [Bacillota bacterium]